MVVRILTALSTVEPISRDSRTLWLNIKAVEVTTWATATVQNFIVETAQVRGVDQAPYPMIAVASLSVPQSCRTPLHLVGEWNRTSDGRSFKSCQAFHTHPHHTKHTVSLSVRNAFSISLPGLWLELSEPHHDVWEAQFIGQFRLQAFADWLTGCCPF